MKDIIKIILFANQKIGIEGIRICKELKNSQIVLVVTCENENDSKFKYPSVVKYCIENNIPNIDPIKHDKKFGELIDSLKPDIGFSLYYRRIIHEDIINMFSRKLIVNAHPSLLPKYRGPTPTMWSLVNGEKKCGITFHEVRSSGIDTGDIILQKKVSIPNFITGHQLSNIVMGKGIILLNKIIPLVMGGKYNTIHQNATNASYYGKIKESFCYINWLHNKIAIDLKVRALTKPFSGAKAIIKGEHIIIWKVTLLKRSLETSGGPGRIIEINDSEELIVNTVDGYIKVIEYDFMNPLLKQNFLKSGFRFEY